MAIFSEIKEIEKDKSIDALRLLLEHFKDKYNLSSEEILNIISEKNKKEVIKQEEQKIPLSIFSNNKLSALEIIVKYLKENLNRSYHEIAVLLNRNDRTIWATYNNSLKKQKTKLILNELKNAKFQNKFIPLSIFSKRTKSVLESLVIYLKEIGFSFKEISGFLLKDYQTIYTTYRKGIMRKKTNDQAK